LNLTLDRTLTFFVWRTLAEAGSKYEAEGGSIIVMEPASGKILAMCNYPDFNPNNYQRVEDLEMFKNVAVTDAYEPGSVFKAITMAMALEENAVDPETTYVDTGQVVIGEHVIKNSDEQAHGTQTMTSVLEKSINTGAIFAARAVGLQKFRNYVKKFGFGSLTKIDLAGEASGNISNLSKGQEIYMATGSFGQGLSVTALQMTNAISAIANQGRLMRPYLVEQMIAEGGEIIDRQPQFIRSVISPSTSAILRAMLVSVVENGYGRKAGVKGYFVAGKTGTAQVPGPEGEYSDKVIHSFVGFAPANKPQFAALVKLDNPQQGNFSDSTAVPTFGQIAQFILKYYQIPPNRE